MNRIDVYTSLVTDALHESGIAGSIGSVGDALDNALMESAIGLYKTELINRGEIVVRPRRGGTRHRPVGALGYNTTRLHSSLTYLSPTAYEARYRDTVASTPEMA